MALARVFIGEQAKEQEYITNPNAPVAEMRLGRPTLPEQTLATREHWVFMAEMVPSNLAPRDPFDNLAQPEVVIGCDRATAGRNGKTYRTSGNNRRGGAAGPRIKPLTAQNY